jgi:hypothetical protein
MGASGGTAGVPSDPCLAWAEIDTDLPGQIMGLGAGHLAIIKAPPVANNERVAVLPPMAHWLEATRPPPLSRLDVMAGGC